MAKKKRIEIIDVAKCLAIFMVVLGHTATNEELLGNPAILYKVIYSIHMPLFFFLTGMSIKPKPLKTLSEWRFFIRKNILTIAFPFLIWSLIYCQFSFDNVKYILFGSWQALGKTGTVTSLWYLSCLFVARIIVEFVVMLMAKFNTENKRMIYLIPAIILLLTGSLIPCPPLGYPWGINVAILASGFILLGIALRTSLIIMAVEKGWIMIAVLIASILLYVLTISLRTDGFEILMMCKGSYGDLIPMFACSIIGGFIVMLVSMVLKRAANEWLNNVSIEPLLYMGAHTMGIFLLHKPILQNILIPLFEKTIPDVLYLPRIIASIAAIAISLILCHFIEYYIPELIGIFSKDKIQGENHD